MFSSKEINNFIDQDYFAVIQATSFAITLQSRNTNHYWHIVHEVGNGYSTCQIYHKHHLHNSWHRHHNKPNLSAALEDIRSHDNFHLQREELKRTPKQH